MSTNSEVESTAAIELAPNYRIPIFLLVAAVACALVSSWLAIAISTLGLFLTIQTILVRLQFTEQALQVLRSGKVILSFPYSEWSNWEIFWSPVPILFYFKEVNSIHFLPIIFDAKTLLVCLNKYYPRQ